MSDPTGPLGEPADSRDLACAPVRNLLSALVADSSVRDDAAFDFSLIEILERQPALDANRWARHAGLLRPGKFSKVVYTPVETRRRRRALFAAGWR
jgi:hypothetical protein